MSEVWSGPRFFHYSLPALCKKSQAMNPINRAVRKASHSPLRYKVGCIGLNRQGQPIVYTSNSPRFKRRGGSVHAEMAMMRLYPKVVRTILLLRVGRSGNLLPIDPCPACARKAVELGIKIVTVQTEQAMSLF